MGRRKWQVTAKGSEVSFWFIKMSLILIVVIVVQL